MMLIKREKMINTFKVLSIVLLTFMIMSLYSLISVDVFSSKIKNNEEEHKLNKKYLKNSFFDITDRNSFCDRITHEKLDSNLIVNRIVYYSFAIFLGAFINAKKIMIIGVI